MMLPARPTHRAFHRFGPLFLLIFVLVVLIEPLSPLGAKALSEKKSQVALMPVIDLKPKPASSWLPPAVLRGLTYTFGKLSYIEFVDQKALERALKAEKLKPSQAIDDQRAIAIGRKLNADLVLTTTYQLGKHEKISLNVRLIEPKSKALKKSFTVRAPVSRILDALTTIALRTASNMNYRITGEERRALKRPITSSFQSFSDYQRALAAYNPEAGTGNLSEAMVLLTNAIKRDPRFTEARFQLGLLAARQGHSEQAARHLQQLVKDDPSYPNAQHNLGLAKLSQGDYAAARRELLKAHQAHPRRANLLNDLALAAYYLKDYKAAQGYLATASQLAPNSSVIWNNLGTVAYSQGAFTEAEKAYAKAVQNNPKSVSPHYNLGLTYLQLAEMEKAKEAFEKTLELDPGHTKTYYSLALIAESDGTGKAAAYWKKYLELAKADPAEQSLVAFAQRELEKQPAPATPQP